MTYAYVHGINDEFGQVLKHFAFKIYFNIVTYGPFL
jgi:hypothetical protein